MKTSNLGITKIWIASGILLVTASALRADEWNDPYTVESVAGVCDVELEATIAQIPAPAKLPGTSSPLQLQAPIYILRRANGNQVNKQGLVGPILRVAKGDKLRIHLKNCIDPSLLLFANDPPDPPDNWPHGYGVTNLHTHGLHVSPKDPSDNVYLELPRGGEHQFEYQIPANHPAGTFWYHPHKHGSVAFQLTGGMAGALIVQGDMDDLPEMPQGNGEKIFVLQQMHMTQQGNLLQADPGAIYDRLKGGIAPPGAGAQNAAGAASSLRTRPGLALRSWRYRRVLKQLETLRQQSGTLGSGRSSATAPKAGETNCQPDPDAVAVGSDAEFLFVNGQYQPTFKMRPGEVQRWRFIHAGLDEVINLCVVENCLDGEKRLCMHEIAVDGLPRGRKVQKTSNLLYPAYRWDVLFQAPQLAKNQKELKLTIYDDCAPGDVTLNETPKFRRIVACIRVCGQSKQDVLPSDERLEETVPKQLRGLITDEEVGNRRWSLRFDFTDTKPSAFRVNGEEFDVDRIDRFVHLDTAEEWTIQSGTGDNNAAGHPFHIHVNPFQQFVYEPVLSLRFDQLDDVLIPVKNLILTLDDPGSGKADPIKVGDKIKITLTDPAIKTPLCSETTVGSATTIGTIIDNLKNAIAKSDFKGVYDVLYDRQSGRPLIRSRNSKAPPLQATVVDCPAASTQNPPLLSFNADRGLVDVIWRDTLLAPSKGPALIVRMRFKDYFGKTVLHCHIVDHEDQGMMKNIFILKKGESIPVAPPRRARRPHANRAPAISQLPTGKAPEWRVPLVDAEGKRHTIAEYANRKRILIFFLGADCPPCLDQLREFRKLEGALDRQRITLIAVSSGSPRDLHRVQTQLANGRPLPFVLLADVDLKVFEQYQLIDKRDSGLLHGIFCIDERGELIWQSGATASPYKNVVDAVNALATQSRPVVTTLR